MTEADMAGRVSDWSPHNIIIIKESVQSRSAMTLGGTYGGFGLFVRVSHSYIDMHSFIGLCFLSLYNDL